MDGIEFGANELDLQEIEALLADETQPETPPVEEGATHTDNDNVETDKKETTDVTATKAFAHRLKESTEKARKEERENIAKSLGYDSYEAMLQQRERKTMADKGLDPDQVSPVIDELVQKRLNDDPRIKELEELKKRQVAEFAKQQLDELKDLTNGEVTSLKQLSKEVVDDFRRTGDLKQSYLKYEGVKLITKLKADSSKGSTTHLANPNGSSGQTKNSRPFTEEEKRVWKLFNPSTTDEELNKMRKVDNT